MRNPEDRSRLLPPDPIAKILKASFQKLKIEDSLVQHRFILSWSEIVGDYIGAHTTPLKVSNGTLSVQVEHPTWVQELNFLKKEFLEKIESQYPESQIRKIQFILK